MPDSELTALGDLAARYADEALITPIQGVHEAVAGRVFRSLGGRDAASVPGIAKRVHDGVSRGVYGALRAGGRGAGSVIAAAGRAAGGEEERTSVSDSRFGRGAQAAINGLIGDRLEDEGSGFRIEMAVRLPGRDVEVSRAGFEEAFDSPTDKVAIFVHGLCEAEEGWWLGTKSDPEVEGPAPRTYGQRLRDELGFSPLYLRYNTGLHISDNGRRLSWLLEEICREWPVAISEIAIVGHSMGGLVARSACQEAADAERDWLGRTRHVICLGAPNTGSWLEKFVNVGGWAMRNVPETRPFTQFLELRSAGIKDLRFGYLRDEDWRDHDPDEPMSNRSVPGAPIPGVSYHFVSGGLTGAERHPVAAVFGDVLVRKASAMSPLSDDGTPHGDSEHLQGASHFHLLNHPDAYAHILRWLETPVLSLES